MSTECSTIVWKRDFGNATRKVIAARLADHADDEGRGIWPSVERVAAQCNASPRTVQRTLAAFVEEGILTVVAEGGKGRRSTTHYDFVMAKLVALPLAWVPDHANSKGDTVSPLAETKGDTGDAKGDTDDALGCHGVTQTVIEPPIEPSSEREGASEREKPAIEAAAESRESIERAFRRWFHTWPTYVSDSEDAARTAWFDLTASERQAAAERQTDYLEAAKAGGRKMVCSSGVYLRERRWEKLPARPRADDKQKPAAPFGKAWSARRMAWLVKPHAPLGPLPAATQRVIDLHPEKERMMLDDHLRQKGWPEVNAMHAKLAEMPPKPVFVSAELIEAGQDFQQVRRGGEVEAAWQRLHERMKLPWLPGNRPEWLYFPPLPEGVTDLDKAVAAAFWTFRERIEGHVHAAAE